MALKIESVYTLSKATDLPPGDTPYIGSIGEKLAEAFVKAFLYGEHDFALTALRKDGVVFDEKNSPPVRFLGLNDRSKYYAHREELAAYMDAAFPDRADGMFVDCDVFEQSWIAEDYRVCRDTSYDVADKVLIDLYAGTVTEIHMYKITKE